MYVCMYVCMYVRVYSYVRVCVLCETNDMCSVTFWLYWGVETLSFSLSLSQWDGSARYFELLTKLCLMLESCYPPLPEKKGGEEARGSEDTQIIERKHFVQLWLCSNLSSAVHQSWSESKLNTQCALYQKCGTYPFSISSIKNFNRGLFFGALSTFPLTLCLNG